MMGLKKKTETISGCRGKNIPWVHLKYTEQPLYEVFSLDADHDWAIGFDGYIYYAENASDFGFDTLTSKGWSDVIFVSQPNPRPDVDFLSLFFTSPQNGFVSGGNNVLLKYTQIKGLEERGGGELGNGEVWPNPTNGKFQISNSIRKLADQSNSKFKNTKNNVQIIDLYGNTVDIVNTKAESRNTKPGSLNLELDINNLPTGIYFVRIFFDNKMIVKKIIKL